MVEFDKDWFLTCCDQGLVTPRLLEIGSAKVQGCNNLCDEARLRGIEALGVDIHAMDGVDAVADFGKPQAEFLREWTAGEFSTVVVFNVLEHTYDPIRILENALLCSRRGATLLVLTPAIWPIHNFPGDFSRLLPDWYRRFAELHSLKIVESSFNWISTFCFEPVSKYPDFPTYISRKDSVPQSRYWLSRIGHKLLNTYGRSHWATHCSVAVAMVRA